jgi:hypothetical protein
MDVSAGLASAAIDTIPAAAEDTATTQSSAFEDRLRQEVVLVPEDLTDIHIQAPAEPADPADAADTTTDTPSKSVASVVTGRTPRKKNLKKKEVAPAPVERTIVQRREQVRPIIDRLTELQMNVSYPAIRELYKQLSHFIKTGEDAKIKIPFPEFSRRIKGELSNVTYIPCWVKLEME